MLLNIKKKLTVILFMLPIVFAQGCGSENEKVEPAKPVRAFKITKTQEPEVPMVEKGTAVVKPPGMQGEETGAVKHVAPPAAQGEKPDEKARLVPAVDVAAGRVREAAPPDVVPIKEETPPEAVRLVTGAKAAPPEAVRLVTGAKAAPPEAVGPVTGAKQAPPVQALTPVAVVAKGYDPAGRIDPFSPLFGEKATGEAPAASSRDKTVREARQAMLTPLEKLDISQLKLVGLVMTPLRKLAMVEDMTGKGYVVKRGTYVGINSGRVVGILKSGVMIEEQVEDYMGKIVVRKRELKLQKPLGEE